MSRLSGEQMLERKQAEHRELQTLEMRNFLERFSNLRKGSDFLENDQELVGLISDHFQKLSSEYNVPSQDDLENNRKRLEGFKGRMQEIIQIAESAVNELKSKSKK